MSAQTYDAAGRLRAKIMRILGSRCNACGSPDELTLDCIKPMGHQHHAAGFIGRQWFYWRQFRQGNIQILCSVCQGIKGDSTQAELLAHLAITTGSQSIPIRIKGGAQVQQHHKAMLPNDMWRLRL